MKPLAQECPQPSTEHNQNAWLPSAVPLLYANWRPIPITHRTEEPLPLLTVKHLLATGRTVRMFGLGQLYSPKLVDVIGHHGGFDALWLDAEHAALTFHDIELATLAARAHGLDPIVRMPATDYARVMQTLEAGAGGLIFSMVQSPEEVEQAVRWAKFTPRGQRGLNGSNVDGGFGLTPLAQYTESANARTFIGIQIETASALEQAAEIAAIPDVDLLFVGPADLSQVLGIPGDFENPRCFEAIDHIAAACKAANKPWGIVPRGPEYAQRMAANGCRMFVLGFDIRAFHTGINTLKQTYTDFYS